ncbi:hypothetical protein GUJ93_ZPchr0005g14709 [Zizania palustris]|uniref:Uncharacterized protein n=1 Tax=Zizania palustris TaxID=103762 RepID=A0A8J5S592_ZIZPA|nr:hypothetical protein GUJ93_ZPchr0005g14709 [Zizania palustris]
MSPSPSRSHLCSLNPSLSVPNLQRRCLASPALARGQREGPFLGATWPISFDLTPFRLSEHIQYVGEAI